MDVTRILRDRLAGQRLMFAYRGEVTSENSVYLLSLLDKEMEFSDFSTIGRKRLFMFILENLQNITRHGEVEGQEVMSLVIYSKTDDGYIVTTGNAIKNEEIDNLKENLDIINNLDPDKIREVYREMLKDSDMSHKGGAGLGLIEMARKTGNKLDYDFREIDSDYSYFVLSKTVDAGGKGVHGPGSDQSYSGARIMELENFMSQHGIYFIWLGHISADMSKEVLSFNEAMMNGFTVDHNLQRRLFTALIELLQNVTQHGAGIEAGYKYGMPVAMIRNNNGSFIITSGNLISNSEVEGLKEKLEMVNRYDEAGLKKLLRSALKGQDMSVSSTGYMGLLEMARHSGNKLEYVFDTVNEEYSYYALTVRIKERDQQAPQQG